MCAGRGFPDLSRVRGPSRSCLKKSHQFRKCTASPPCVRACDARGCGIRDAAQGSGTACKTSRSSALSGFRGSPESPATGGLAPARCGGRRLTMRAHARVPMGGARTQPYKYNDKRGVQHARSSAESFALCKTPRAVQTSARAQDVAAEGCGKLSRESSHASPRPPRVRVRPMTDLRLWRQIVPGGNLALR